MRPQMASVYENRRNLAQGERCCDSGNAGSEANLIAAFSLLAIGPTNCGALAFSRTGDPGAGEFPDAVVIGTFGEADAARA